MRHASTSKGSTKAPDKGQACRGQTKSMRVFSGGGEGLVRTVGIVPTTVDSYRKKALPTLTKNTAQGLPVDYDNQVAQEH